MRQSMNPGMILGFQFEMEMGRDGYRYGNLRVDTFDKRLFYSP